MVTGVTGIIEATGYQADPDLFDGELKRLLGYDNHCPRIPLLLSRGSVFATKVSNLAFVGFYEGPYWGVMEMQARLIAETWVQEKHTPRDEQAKIYQPEDAKNIRCALEENPEHVPQFWMGDYVGLVEELARETRATRNDSTLGTRMGPLSPSRYCSGQSSADALAVIEEISHVVQGSSTKAQFVPTAVFRGLQGLWSLQRTIEVHGLPSASGSFVGAAHFHPRIPTSAAYTTEYLYVEEGIFASRSGVSMPISRRYVYRYDEVNDIITTWLTAKDGKTAAAQCMSWTFEAPPSSYTGWVANGEHRCARESYREKGEFTFDGAYLDRFILTTSVDGSSKKYIHVSLYSRPEI